MHTACRWNGGQRHLMRTEEGALADLMVIQIQTIERPRGMHQMDPVL